MQWYTEDKEVNYGKVSKLNKPLKGILKYFFKRHSTKLGEKDPFEELENLRFFSFSAETGAILLLATHAWDEDDVGLLAHIEGAMLKEGHLTDSSKNIAKECKRRFLADKRTSNPKLIERSIESLIENNWDIWKTKNKFPMKVL